MASLIVVEDILNCVENNVEVSSWDDILLLLLEKSIELNNREVVIRSFSLLVEESVRHQKTWLLDEVLSSKNFSISIQDYFPREFIFELRKKILKRYNSKRSQNKFKNQYLCLCCFDFFIDKEKIYNFPMSNIYIENLKILDEVFLELDKLKVIFLLNRMVQKYHEKYGVDKCFWGMVKYIEDRGGTVDLNDLTKVSELEFLFSRENLKDTISIIMRVCPEHDNFVDEVIRYFINKKKNKLANYFYKFFSSYEVRIKSMFAIKLQYNL